eukprot:5187595-Pyramimonas_sp.AAC.1
MESLSLKFCKARPVAYRTPLNCAHARPESNDRKRTASVHPSKKSLALSPTLGNKSSHWMRGNTAFPGDIRRRGVVASESVTVCGVKTAPQKAGNGGNGEILTEVKSKTVKNFKYNHGGSSVRIFGLVKSRPTALPG